MRRAAPLLVLLAACDRAPGEPATATSSAPAATFAREAFAPRGGDAGPSEPAVPASVDPAALDEILAAAPKATARPATGPDGGTALGTETGVRGDAGAGEASAGIEARRGPKVDVGKPVAEADMSNPLIEQTARAQLYWGLTQRCRGDDGRILPPEAVRVIFQIDADGYLVPPSIVAHAKEERFAAAARCVARELSTTTFRAPPAARGRPHTITSDVPSVD
jgi:hypothetical protein